MSSQILDIETTKPTPLKGKTYHPIYVYASVLYCALGCLFFGYVLSAFNPISNFVEYNAYSSPVTSVELNLMTSFVPLGAAFGALSGGKICSKIGRRISMILLDILGIIGTGLTLLPTPYGLIIGRLLQGYCVGANSSVIPVYINEVSPSEITGSNGTFFQLFINIGIILTPILGLGMPTGNGDEDPDNGYWRVVLGLAAVPCILRLILSLTFFRLDTPKFLVSVDKEEAAVRRLRKIYKENRVQDELDELKKEIAAKSEKGKMSILEAFRPKYRRRVIIGTLVSAFQQLSGINAIIFFSNDIFDNGVPEDSKKPTVYTIIMAIVLFLSTLLSTFIIEKLGRRRLLIGGMGSIAVILTAFSIVGISDDESPALKFFIWGYMIPFGLSLGPLPWVYISDILPDVFIGIAVLFNWLLVFAIGIAFPPISEALGTPECFLFFAVCSLIGTVFMMIWCKETKGKTEAEITEMFGGKKKQVDDGRNIEEENKDVSKVADIAPESSLEKVS